MKLKSQQLKVSTEELVLGMYVASIDRPWVETPFCIDGFHVKTVDDIKKLNRYCKFVYIDTTKGKKPLKKTNRNLTILSSARENSPKVASLFIRRDIYKNSRPMKKEIDTAIQLYTELCKECDMLISKIRAKQSPSFDQLYEILNKAVASILRNADAFIWHVNVNSDDGYAYTHEVRATIWGLIFGRHLGFSSDDLFVLAQGILLADIGFAKLPESLVNKSGPFKRKEYLAYRKHISLGLDILKTIPGLDPRVLSTIKNHHERHDGRGFPKGLKGDQIPIMAKIANLAYCYDRLLGSKSREESYTPAQAIGRIYKLRKIKFQDELVCEFIRAIGMYPSGSIVELNTKEVAIVIEQNEQQRLLPKVLLVLDEAKKSLKDSVLLDLQNTAGGKPNLTGIKQSLDNGSFGLNAYDFTNKIVGKKFNLGPIGFRI